MYIVSVSINWTWRFRAYHVLGNGRPIHDDVLEGMEIVKRGNRETLKRFAHKD